MIETIILILVIAFTWRVLSRAKAGKPPFEFKRRADRPRIKIYEIGDARAYMLRDPAMRINRQFETHADAVRWCQSNGYEAVDE